MAGASKGNPLAEDFRGLKPGQNVPPIQLGALLDAQLVPSAQWLADNAAEIKRAEAAKEPLPQCPPDQADVRIVIIGAAMVPKLTLHPRDYPYAQAPLGVLMTMPWAARFVDGNLVPGYRDLIVAQNPHMADELGSLTTDAVKAAGGG
jgi:hypothetical protein